ncbi:MAG: methyltransferase domain-containing protein [Candidatus Bathyarchaeia archaeon]
MQESAIIKRLVEFPYLPSPLSVIEAALSMVEVKPYEVFADLGCGDGSVLIEAAKKFGVYCVGFEVNPTLVTLAHKKAEIAGVKHLIDIVCSDLFTIDFSRFNVIYVYPFPPIIPRLSEKIVCECRKGTRVLVHDYSLSGLKPTKSAQTFERGIHVHLIYLYTM